LIWTATAVITDAIRAKLNQNPTDITRVMGDIRLLLDNPL
jgi:hypothetical protein